MNAKSGLIAISLIILSTLACHAKTPIGKSGDWQDTIAAAALNGKIYTIEKGGNLYATTPNDGTWKKIGKPDFAATAFLIPLENQLASIEKDGSLYIINPADGAWRQAGKAGDWKDTIAAAALDGKIYTIEKGGSLYATTPNDGAWAKIGNPDFAATAFLVPLENQLASIEKDGSLYIINPADGAWRQAGESGDFKGIAAATAAGGIIHATAMDGAIITINPATGAKTSADAEAHPGARFMVAAGQGVFTISGDGDLNGVSTANAQKTTTPAKTTAAPAVEENTNPALAGQLTFKFMGKWQGDTTELERDPGFQKHKAAAPESAQKVIDIMQGMVMKVTLDGVSMTVIGQTTGPDTFEAISAAGDSLVIEFTSGPKKGTRSRIVFRDDKHIQVLEGADEGKAMFFRKN